MTFGTFGKSLIVILPKGNESTSLGTDHFQKLSKFGTLRFYCPKDIFVVCKKSIKNRGKQISILLQRMNSSSSQCSDGSPPRKKAKCVVKRDSSKWDLASLPRHILLKIFTYLDLKSINNCAMLCSTLYNLSKDSSLYKTVILKYNMNTHFLESLISRISRPLEVTAEYKFYDQHAEQEDYEDFDEYIRILLRKCGDYVLSLKIESCRNEQLLLYIGECTNLKKLASDGVNDSEGKRVKSKSLRTLARLTNLQTLELISGPGFDSDPEDALEQLAAGCPQLNKLVIYGWKEINDDNFIPALHMFAQLRALDLRGTNITIKSGREAALSLPLLNTMDVVKNHRIKKCQLAQLQKDFMELHIPLE